MREIKELMNEYNRTIVQVRPLLDDKNLPVALEKTKQATILMYEVAKISHGTDRKKYLKRAERLHDSYNHLKAILGADDTLSDTPSFEMDSTPLEPQDSNEDKDNKNPATLQGVPDTSFEDIVGMESLKETIRTSVINPLIKPELYQGYAVNQGGGVFLYGPPGTGKTMMAAAIAHEVDAPFITIKGSDIFDKWQGETEKNIQATFAKAREYKRCVIFFDEMDAIMPKDSSSTGAKQARAELLSQMQGIEHYYSDGRTKNEMLLFIGATNKPWDIDPAFLREGRFGDHKIYVGLPNEESRKKLLDIYLSTLDADLIDIDESVDLDELSQLTESLSGASIKSLFEKAQMSSIQRAEKTGRKVLMGKDFKNSLRAFKKIKNNEPDAVYEKWQTSHEA